MNDEIGLQKIQAKLEQLSYSWQKGRIKDIEKYDKEYDEPSLKIAAAPGRLKSQIKLDDYFKAARFAHVLTRF